jgi:hypothetical protein
MLGALAIIAFMTGSGGPAYAPRIDSTPLLSWVISRVLDRGEYMLSNDGVGEDILRLLRKKLCLSSASCSFSEDSSSSSMVMGTSTDAPLRVPGPIGRFRVTLCGSIPETDISALVLLRG